MACSTSREVTRSNETTELRSSELRSSDLRDSVMVAVHDTIMETVTIVVRENEQGDTISHSVITDRLRLREMSDVRRMKEDVRMRVDTVFIEKRDSVSTTTNLANPKNKASPFVTSLKWIFFIIIALIGLKICSFFRRE